MQIAEGARRCAWAEHRSFGISSPRISSYVPDGTVKVLDFGIAKALEPDNLTTAPPSPMLTTPATQVGVILGTAAYMSPEQAKGKPVDQRADIWAFGCVLYEMLTGQPAFGGEDVPTTLARVITNDSNIESLPDTISPAVRRTINLCLADGCERGACKLSGDARLALEGAFESVSSRGSRGCHRCPTIAAVGRWLVPFPLLIGAAVMGLIAWESLAPRRRPRHVNRFDFEVPAETPFRNIGRPVIALSPDGRRFVYNVTDGLYYARTGRTRSASDFRDGAGLGVAIVFAGRAVCGLLQHGLNAAHAYRD